MSWRILEIREKWVSCIKIGQLWINLITGTSIRMAKKEGIDWMRTSTSTSIAMWDKHSSAVESENTSINRLPELISLVDAIYRRR